LGYSKKFIENMEKAAQLFRSNGAVFSIINATDFICSVCPYNKNESCAKEQDSERRVRSKDLEVMSRLGLKVGDQLRSDELLKLIKERMSPADITEVCQGCDWLDLGYCAEGLKSLNPGAEATKR
jgi:hypothetical protein